MSIRIIKQPDVELTEAEYRRFHDEYQALCSFYCGTPPSFEEFARGKKATERERGERALGEMARLTREIGQEL